jgi:hypothetical protein
MSTISILYPVHGQYVHVFTSIGPSRGELHSSAALTRNQFRLTAHEYGGIRVASRSFIVALPDYRTVTGTYQLSDRRNASWAPVSPPPGRLGQAFA